MAGSVRRLDVGRKRKKSVMGTYFPTIQQMEAWTWCVKNNIRISPYGVQNDTDHWHIAISLGPYKKWEKPNLSPSKYCRKTIWVEYYKMCKYYYDKYRK